MDGLCYRDASPKAPVHSTMLAQRPVSVLDADKDAHTSVSEDAGTVPFTALCLTSVHCERNQ